MHKHITPFEGEQVDLFADTPVFRIQKPIRLIELFAGIGTQSLALDYLGVDYESWRISEWAVKSIQAYALIHHADDDFDYTRHMDKDTVCDLLYEFGISADHNKPMTRAQIGRMPEAESRNTLNAIYASDNLGSITGIHGSNLNIVERNDYCYVMTYSFPCQNLSNSGRRAGMVKGSGTRSGLLWEVERILTELGDDLPHVLLMENVPAILAKKNKSEFDKWCEFLHGIGYTNYYKCLNAKEVGYPEPVPQNRDRCFMVSILGDYKYKFPEKQVLKTRLKDVLETDVDEKYFLSDAAISGLILHREKQKEAGNSFGFHVTDVSDDDSAVGTIRTFGNYSSTTPLLKNAEFVERERDGRCADDQRGSEEYIHVHRDGVSPTIRSRYYKDGSESLIGEFNGRH